MTSLSNPTHPASHRTRIVTQFGVRLFTSFGLGVATVALSWFAAGPGLGVYFGTVLLVTLVCPFLASMPTIGGTGVPPVLLAHEHGRSARATEILGPVLIAIFLWFGITVGWCVSLISPDVSILNIALCLIVLGAISARWPAPLTRSAASGFRRSFRERSLPFFLSPGLPGPCGSADCFRARTEKRSSAGSFRSIH